MSQIYYFDRSYEDSSPGDESRRGRTKESFLQKTWRVAQEGLLRTQLSSLWLSLAGHGLGTCSACSWLLWQPTVGKEVSSLMVKSKKDQENWKPRLTLKGWWGKEPVGEAGMRQVWRGRDPASRGAEQETQSAGRGDVWPGRAAEPPPDLAFT